jgi:hypothetical protein
VNGELRGVNAASSCKPLLYDDAAARSRSTRGRQSSGQGQRHGLLDGNGNGKRDEGEYVLPDVQVTVGLYGQRTDARGQFRLWPLSAFDPVVAAVDTTSLPSPLWLPAFSGIELNPLPNRFTTLDIPVLPGGLIEGRVMRSRRVPGYGRRDAGPATPGHGPERR